MNPDHIAALVLLALAVIGTPWTIYAGIKQDSEGTE